MADDLPLSAEFAAADEAKWLALAEKALDGAPMTLTASGFEALAFQHEMDHLSGMLFLDRIQSHDTDLFRRKNP